MDWSELSLRKNGRHLQSENETDSCLSPLVDAVTDGFRLFSWIWFTSGITVIVISSFWWYSRRDTMYLKRRNPEVLPLVCVGFVANLLTGPLYRATSTDENLINSCVFTNFMFNLVAPPFVAVQVIRLLLFRNRVRYNKKVAELFSTSKPTMDSTMSSIETDLSQDKYETILRPLKDKATAAYGLKLGFIYLILIALFCTGFVATTCKTFMTPENDCNFSIVASSSAVFFLLPIVFTGALQFHISYQTKGEPDPFHLLSEIKWSYVFPLFLTFLGIVLGTVNVGGYDSADVESFNWAVVIDFAVLWFFVYTVPYRVWQSYRFQNSEQYVNVRLKDVLSSPTGEKLFEQHLVNEFSTENLTFWRAVQKWKKSFAANQEDSQERMAKNIYNRWLKPGSVLRVNISSVQSEHVREILESTEMLPLSLFDEASNEVYRLMSNDSFQRFKGDPLFAEFYGLEEPSMAAISEPKGSLHEP
mmetsp:Transcript_4694/g.6245  ORF Transcript_4694/g.6245 Transcript_4694/m.6245 type:complete len:474 (+) Transcript_4694:191-1612(+)